MRHNIDNTDTKKEKNYSRKISEKHCCEIESSWRKSIEAFVEEYRL